MPVTLTQQPDSVLGWPRTHVLQDPSWGSFSLKIRKPTYEEILVDQGYIYARIAAATSERGPIIAQQMKTRIANVVVDWEDVTDDAGKPIKYSYHHLQRMMESYPKLVDEVLSLCSDAYRGMTVDERKNLLRSPGSTS